MVKDASNLCMIAAVSKTKRLFWELENGVGTKCWAWRNSGTSVDTNPNFNPNPSSAFCLKPVVEYYFNMGKLDTEMGTGQCYSDAFLAGMKMKWLLNTTVEAVINN